MTSLPLGLGDSQPETTICSAKGCQNPAVYALVWNNPKLHAADREKLWLACEDHRESLSLHLDVRGFLRRVDPFTPSGPLESSG